MGVGVGVGDGVGVEVGVGVGVGAGAGVGVEVGAGAGEMLGEAMIAIEMSATARDIAMTMHAHPTLLETLGEAAEGMYGLSPHQQPKRDKAKA